MAELFPSNLVPRAFPSLLGEEKALGTSLISKPSPEHVNFPTLGEISYDQNSQLGDRPHSQNPVGSPIPPPPPPSSFLGLNIDRCIKTKLHKSMVETGGRNESWEAELFVIVMYGYVIFPILSTGCLTFT